MSGRIKISPSSFNESLILEPRKLLFHNFAPRQTPSSCNSGVETTDEATLDCQAAWEQSAQAMDESNINLNITKQTSRNSKDIEGLGVKGGDAETASKGS